jgi:hypothetical protein
MVWEHRSEMRNTVRRGVSKCKYPEEGRQHGMVYALAKQKWSGEDSKQRCKIQWRNE